jgi:hypothetical protein
MRGAIIFLEENAGRKDVIWRYRPSPLPHLAVYLGSDECRGE